MLGPACAGASRRLRSSLRGRHMTWHPGRAFRAASWAARAGLRAAGAQALLSELAACACIGLVASADHVNAPLLWDKQARAGPHALRFDPGAPAGCFGAQVAFGPAGALRPPFHTLLACCRAAARALTAPQPQRGPRPRRVRAGATATGRHALSSARLGTAVLPASHWRMCLPG
jgi:hypothetical protein